MGASRINIMTRFTGGVILILTSLFFFESMKDLILRWLQTGSYYTQGPLIFVLFFYILYKKYKTAVTTPENSHVTGIFLISLSLFVDLFGRYASIVSLQFFSIYLFIAGGSFFFLGKSFIYHNKSLFVFLLLAIPFPAFILDHATFYMKLAAANISGLLLHMIYPSTVLHGTTLSINGYYIEVSPACSGMHNIFGMASLLWFFAIFQKRNSIAALDYILTIPAAIISNILRILIVTILTVQGLGKFALGTFHEVIGVIIFIIIFAIVAPFNEWPAFKSGRIENSGGDDFADHGNKKSIALLLVIMSIMTAASAAFMWKSTGQTKKQYHPERNSILAETPGWKSYDEALGENYFSMLNTDDILMRGYYKKNDSPGKTIVYLYFVHAIGDRTPFLHRPDLCLKNEGYNLLDKKVTILPTTGMPASRMLFARGKKGLLVYYWYRYNGRQLGAYSDLQLNMLTDMITGRSDTMDCSMIRLSMVVDPPDTGKDEAILREFAEKEIPLIFRNSFE